MTMKLNKYRNPNKYCSGIITQTQWNNWLLTPKQNKYDEADMTMSINITMDLSMNTYRLTPCALQPLYSVCATSILDVPGIFKVDMFHGSTVNEKPGDNDRAYLLELPLNAKCESVRVHMTVGQLKWAPWLQDGNKLWVAHPGRYYNNNFEPLGYATLTVLYDLEDWESRVRRTWT